ncbi:helix-turn-helix domain-containing protein [Treponema phagedenis]|uniref:helix-turn-helix domain-containing protein n=1 Tax=Treponema phagedenis TaxID=162 RepID=UPI0011E65F84|nr:helix-turn-helix domain-containing protein [Treponema phagedenis]QEK07832.1 helix-turn-helix domain-containing protein [Treponema phagedenis]
MEVLLKAGHTVKDIANELNRDRRTIEREIKKEFGNKTNRKSVCKPKPKSARLSDQEILSCR